jgi:hypothetical protein
MATFVAAGTPGTTSATLPAGTASGDWVIVFAYRNAATAPTLPASWTTLTTTATNPATLVAFRQYDGVWTMPTFTNATRCVSVSVRKAAAAVGLAAGTVANQAASSATPTWAAQTPLTADGTSVVLRGANDTRPDIVIPTPTNHTLIDANGVNPGFGTYRKNSSTDMAVASVTVSRSTTWTTAQVEIRDAVSVAASVATTFAFTATATAFIPAVIDASITTTFTFTATSVKPTTSRLYFVLNSQGSAGYHRGHNDVSVAGQNATWTVHGLAFAAGPSAQNITSTSITGPTIGIEIGQAGTTTGLEFISLPIAEDVALSHAWNVLVLVGQSAQSNVTFNVRVQLIAAADGAMSNMGQSVATTEIPFPTPVQTGRSALVGLTAHAATASGCGCSGTIRPAGT